MTLLPEAFRSVDLSVLRAKVTRMFKECFSGPLFPRAQRDSPLFPISCRLYVGPPRPLVRRPRAPAGQHRRQPRRQQQEDQRPGGQASQDRQRVGQGECWELWSLRLLAPGALKKKLSNHFWIDRIGASTILTSPIDRKLINITISGSPELTNQFLPLQSINT